MDRLDDTNDSVSEEADSESTAFISSSRRKHSASKTRRKMGDKVPLGMKIVQRFCIPTVVNRILWYRVYIMVLTFIFYATYHLSRRPLSVVKNRLHQNCTDPQISRPSNVDPDNSSTWCSWAPFDGDNYTDLYGYLDLAYWLAYAFGMFFVGHIAERTNLRKFLSAGMILAGFWTICTGLAYFWQIHSFSYFVSVQLLGGVFQATGWPSVVTLMGNWFGKKRLGLIFGIWNSHTSVGNILGAVIAGEWSTGEWGYSFIVPGIIIAVAGVFAYFFVVVRPEDVDLPPPDHVGHSMTPGAPSEVVISEDKEDLAYAGTPSSSVEAIVLHEPDQPISIWRAVRIPGVIEFSVCLFFAKAVSYTFLVWLPKYIHDVIKVDNNMAADLSAIFDAGGIAGGILAGWVSDVSGGSATVCSVMFIFAAPLLWCLVAYAGSGSGALITLLLFTGLFVNGPYALITTAVSTDLGTHPSLTGNSKALATVTAIIDGTGSLGAAFGPLIATSIMRDRGWDAVFYFLIAAQIVALLCLSRLVFREIRGWIKSRRRSVNL